MVVEECMEARCSADREKMAWRRNGCRNESVTIDVPQIVEPVMCGPSIE